MNALTSLTDALLDLHRWYLVPPAVQSFYRRLDEAPWQNLDCKRASLAALREAAAGPIDEAVWVTQLYQYPWRKHRVALRTLCERRLAFGTSAAAWMMACDADLDAGAAGTDAPLALAVELAIKAIKAISEQTARAKKVSMNDSELMDVLADTFPTAWFYYVYPDGCWEARIGHDGWDPNDDPEAFPLLASGWAEIKAPKNQHGPLVGIYER